MKVQHTINIARHPEEVFDFVADFENAPRWQKGMVTATKTTEGPIRVGTKFAEQVRIMGRTVESVGEITAIEPGRSLEFAMTSRGPIECRGRFTFAAAGDGTSVNLAGDFKLKGIWKLMTPLAGREIRSETAKELEALKVVLEGEATATSPATPASAAPASNPS